MFLSPKKRKSYAAQIYVPYFSFFFFLLQNEEHHTGASNRLNLCHNCTSANLPPNAFQYKGFNAFIIYKNQAGEVAFGALAWFAVIIPFPLRRKNGQGVPCINLSVFLLLHLSVMDQFVPGFSCAGWAVCHSGHFSTGTIAH